MTRCLRPPLALVYPGLPATIFRSENWQKRWLSMPTEIKIKLGINNEILLIPPLFQTLYITALKTNPNNFGQTRKLTTIIKWSETYYRNDSYNYEKYSISGDKAYAIHRLPGFKIIASFRFTLSIWIKKKIQIVIILNCILDINR